MPRLLRRELPEFEIRTVQEEGWSGLSNGVLLRKAQSTFEVLVTVDKRLQHQQNIASLRLAIVVVATESTRLVHMRAVIPQLKQAILRARPGTVVSVAAV
jgi:hypothetical protein